MNAKNNKNKLRLASSSYIYSSIDLILPFPKVKISFGTQSILILLYTSDIMFSSFYWKFRYSVTYTEIFEGRLK